MSKPLYALSLLEAQTAMRAGETTSTALTRALLDRIAATDANVQAWACLDPEAALAHARRCDAQRQAGLSAGPLAGIGIGVKDIVATAELPTGLGSPIYTTARPPCDAECVLRLRRAGGFVLGKTVTTEFAFMHPGKTRNPWAAAHTPGGSSSGSAAAVALGQVAAAIGTQTNGSVIRPAAYCGVVGFKPTVAALPFEGAHLFSPTLDTLGVFARRVEDCALFASCLADPGAFAAEVAPCTRPPRLALLPSFPWAAAGVEQERAMLAAVATLRERGAMVATITLPEVAHDAKRTHRTIMFFEGARRLGELQTRERARLSAVLNAALDEGRAITVAEHAAALTRRGELIAACSEWLAPFDAIVCPPASGPAPADLTQTGDPSCCTLWSLLGFPALTIPIAKASNGLPLGLQLATTAGGDERLLAAALWCAAQLPFAGLV